MVLLLLYDIQRIVISVS